MTQLHYNTQRDDRPKHLFSSAARRSSWAARRHSFPSWPARRWVHAASLITAAFTPLWQCSDGLASGIEVSSRFVKKEKLRLQDQSPGQGNSLRLPSRQDIGIAAPILDSPTTARASFALSSIPSASSRTPSSDQRRRSPPRWPWT